MALADILIPDGDVQEAKDTLISTMHVVSGAAREYAASALNAANDVLSVAMAGGPCAAAYTSYTEISRYQFLADKAKDSTVNIMRLLEGINESGDEWADSAYSDHLREITRLDEVSAVMEGTENRLKIINGALPSEPQPAARFDASVFNIREPENGK